MSEVHIFVSFDIHHDGELYELLRTHSEVPSAGFSVVGGSERSTWSGAASQGIRQRMREVDQVIFICGEHTETSADMAEELRIAQEEETPYFLLWGRREIMCTKPAGAKRTDGMYTWTREILREQISITSRTSLSDVVAAAARPAVSKG